MRRFLLVWHIDSHILLTYLMVAKMLIMLLMNFYPIKAMVPHGANYLFYAKPPVKLYSTLLICHNSFKRGPLLWENAMLVVFLLFSDLDCPFLELCEPCWATKIFCDMIMLNLSQLLDTISVILVREGKVVFISYSVFLSTIFWGRPSPKVFSLHDILGSFMKGDLYRFAYRENAFLYSFSFLMLTQPRYLSDLVRLWVHFFHLSLWWPKSMYTFVQE